MSSAVKQVHYLGKGTYLQARQKAADYGLKLAGHLLLDSLLAPRTLWPDFGKIQVWTNEFLVFPAIGRMFEKDVDVVDHYSRDKRVWLLPREYVPQEAIGIPRAALLIDPVEVEINSRLVVVHPVSIKILFGFQQEPSFVGKADPDIGLPLVGACSQTELRFLYRISETGVRPLVLVAEGLGLATYNIEAAFSSQSRICEIAAIEPGG
ncbi:MAG: hypothetical protein ABII22_01970 [Candidatus Micrarchaeota archaeon]